MKSFLIHIYNIIFGYKFPVETLRIKIPREKMVECWKCGEEFSLAHKSTCPDPDCA
jgi:hypothetical protein